MSVCVSVFKLVSCASSFWAAFRVVFVQPIRCAFALPSKLIAPNKLFVWYGHKHFNEYMCVAYNFTVLTRLDMQSARGWTEKHTATNEWLGNASIRGELRRRMEWKKNRNTNNYRPFINIPHTRWLRFDGTRTNRAKAHTPKSNECVSHRKRERGQARAITATPSLRARIKHFQTERACVSARNHWVMELLEYGFWPNRKIRISHYKMKQGAYACVCVSVLCVSGKYQP